MEFRELVVSAIYGLWEIHFEGFTVPLWSMWIHILLNLSQRKYFQFLHFFKFCKFIVHFNRPVLNQKLVVVDLFWEHKLTCRLIVVLYTGDIDCWKMYYLSLRVRMLWKIRCFISVSEKKIFSLHLGKYYVQRDLISRQCKFTENVRANQLHKWKRRWW